MSELDEISTIFIIDLVLLKLENVSAAACVQFGPCHVYFPSFLFGGRDKTCLLLPWRFLPLPDIAIVCYGDASDMHVASRAQWAVLFIATRVTASQGAPTISTIF